MAGNCRAKRPADIKGKAKQKHKNTPSQKHSPYNRTPEQQFLAWCKKAGLKHPKCTIGQTAVGRGVIATENIKKGEVVIEVPDSAVLMVEQCHISEELYEAGLAKGVAGDALLEVQGLILAIMAEKASGAVSDWAPYLSFIPEEMSHMPMYWEPDDLSELSGTAAMDKMEGKVQTPADAPTQVRMLWEEIAQPFIMEYPALKIPSGAKGWSLYQWATAAVSSYSFIIGESHYQAMVPFWDALNHITGAVNVRLNHQPKRGGDGCLQMIATHDITQGEELVNNYGELSQAELLRAYGYVEVHPNANLYAHVQVPLKFVIQAAAAVIKAGHAAFDQDRCEHGDAAAGYGSDSDGGSDWGLDSDGDDDDNNNDVPNQNGQDKQQSGIDAASPEGGQQGSGTAGLLAAQCGSMRMNEMRRSIRGLPGRLRFLKRVGLLPKANIFKVFTPDVGESSRPGAAQLAESLRLLMLPYDRWSVLRKDVMSWRPTAPASATDNNGNPGVDVPGTAALEGSALVVVVRDVGMDMATHVRNAVCCVAHHMLSRYTCSIEADEQLLGSVQLSKAATRQNDEGMDKDGAKSGEEGDELGVTGGPLTRKMLAVVARAPEKRCLHALLAWWGGDGRDQKDEGKDKDESHLQLVLQACWGRPRPGMYGMPKAADSSDSEDDSDGSEEDEREEGDLGEGDDEENEKEEGATGEEDDTFGEGGVAVKKRPRSVHGPVQGGKVTGKQKRAPPAEAHATIRSSKRVDTKVVVQGTGKGSSATNQEEGPSNGSGDTGVGSERQPVKRPAAEIGFTFAFNL